ncbi:MAG: YdeI/OmpD-associated family protein [Armatimonadaceae bacterium]
MPETENKLSEFCPANRAQWREWLEANHATAPRVWLVYWKKATGKPSVTYDEVVEECLCFGWIDSKAQPVDAERYRQMITPRKAKSVWSKVNKERIERLLASGLMTPAGMQKIEAAIADGSWTALDEVEALVIPPDLQAAFDANPPAAENFAAFSRTSKRNTLQWIAGAKRDETRQKRIQETAELAARNIRARQ